MKLRPFLTLVASVGVVLGIGLYIIDGVMGMYAAGMNLLPMGHTAVLAAFTAMWWLGLLIARERGKAPRLMDVGLALGGVSFVLWFIVIWSTLGGRRDVTVPLLLAIGSGGWALLAMVVGLVLCQPAPRRLHRIVRGGTIAAVVLLALEVPVALYVVGALELAQDGIFRVIAATSVLVVAGLITNLILGRIRELAEVPGSERPVVGLKCPRCAKRQLLAMDGDRCGRCGLWIKVHVP